MHPAPSSLILVLAVVGFACGTPSSFDAGSPTGGGFTNLGAGNAGGGSSGGGSSGGGASGGGAAGGRASEPPSTSCQQTLDCMFACTMGDTPCQNACYARGSVDGNAKLLAFAECVDAKMCNDTDCIVAECSDSLLACADASKPDNTGTPLPGQPPPGNVPADLVGRWSGANGGETHRLVFNADGSGSWETINGSTYYGCINAGGLTRTGTFVVEPTRMTLSATSVVSFARVCSAASTSQENLPAQTYLIHWHRHETDPSIIFLIDGACAAQYPGWETCNTLGCPVGLYCTGRLTRE